LDLDALEDLSKAVSSMRRKEEALKRKEAQEPEQEDGQARPKVGGGGRACGPEARCRSMRWDGCTLADHVQHRLHAVHVGMESWGVMGGWDG
jgi:hypothetical protein